MTTIDQARTAVYDRFVAQWANRTPFTFENEKWEEPKPDVDWVRVSVRNTGGGQETLGPKTQRKYRRRGSIFVQVFTPVAKGMKAGAGHAQAARAIFEGESFTGIDANNGVIRESGSDGKFYQTLVEVFFDYTEIK